MEQNIEGKKTSLGLNENVEAFLAYLLGWLTGIVFLVLEKESEFVKFHAMQSTIAFIGFTVISIIFSFPLQFIPILGILVALIDWLIWIVALITWIICLVKAYKGERFKLPIVGNWAERAVK